MSGALARLGARLAGRVWDRSAADREDYDRERAGFNLALDHRPELVLAAGATGDIAAGIRFAVEQGLAVDLQATGHGAHRDMTGGMLITTRQLSGVRVDPARRVARIDAGATSADVIAATAAHGLAAPVGSAVTVGYVSYSLGGGLGMLGRRHGYAADAIRTLDVVTADGRELTVSAQHHPELFWGLRGGGSGLAAVTAIEVELIPLRSLWGGGLLFDGDRAAEVIAAFRACAAGAPRELSLSIAFLRFPDAPAVPEPLQGRYCAHVRVAHLGDAASGEALVAPLRALSPMLDTVRTLALTEIGGIHADPRNPMPVRTESAALDGDGALDELPALLTPDAPFLLEVRQLGGALAEQPETPDAVGHRCAALNLFLSAFPSPEPEQAVAAQRHVLDALGRFSRGGPLRNFLPSGYADASSCYEAPLSARLGGLKSEWDPENVFAYAPGVRPGPRAAQPGAARIDSRSTIL